MATATPLGPPGPQTAQKQHARLLKLDAQPSAARIRLPKGAARKVSAPVRRACIPDTYAAPGPNREPGRILIPGDGAAGDQGAQNRPACPAMAATRRLRAVPVPTTSWHYGLRRTCRLVTGRSHRPRSTWPDQARLAPLAVTHHHKRARCLLLEQFQIADLARLRDRYRPMAQPLRSASYDLVGRAAGSIASNAALCVGARASLISYPVRFSGLLPGDPSVEGADWHVASRGRARCGVHGRRAGCQAVVT
jgi:hypothetical protein